MNTPLWTCDDLILACNGTLFDPNVACAPISGIEIDSRNCSGGDLFVALAGNNQDGHDFLGKAANAGATACLVSRPQNDLSTSQIIVDDTLAGLARLGAAGPEPVWGQHDWHYRVPLAKLAPRICCHIY